MRGWLRAALIAALFICGTAVGAQTGTRYDGVVLNPQGRPVPGATIRACDSTWAGTAASDCTPLISLFSDYNLSQAKNNPFTADGFGNYFFFAACGVVNIQISGPGIARTQIDDVLLPCENPPTPPSSLSGVVQPGVSGGTVTDPTSAPTITNSTTGGTIPAGTYYIKVSYLTCSNSACTTYGETLPSPSQSVVTTGATSRLQVPVNDTTDVKWRSGAVAYYTYASSDNVSFFRQTLDPVNGNQGCQLDTQAHIVDCGSGAVLTSLAFSGSAPVGANGTAISALQVALNSQSTYGNPNTVDGMVLSYGTQTMTTPLVISQYHRLSCVAPIGAQNTSAGKITSSITHPKLATVMITGTSTMEGCDIRNTAGNALLLQTQNNGGLHTRIAGGSIVSSATSGGYDSVRIVGIWYNLHFDQVYIGNSDRANIGTYHISGGDWTITGSAARWDVGDHALRNLSGKSDPDLDSDYSGSFPNGLNNVVFQSVLFESGDKEWFHAVNVMFKLYNCQFADPSTDAATSAMLLIGTDSNNAGGSMTDIGIYSTFFQNNANFGAGIKLESNANAAFNYVTVTATDLSTTNLVDYNNVTTAPQFIFIGSQARPYEAATSRKFINVPIGRFPVVIGTHNDGVTETQRAMNSIYGGTVFVDQNNNTNRRYFYWRSTAIFSYYECDPATATCLAFDNDFNDFRWYKNAGSGNELLHINRNSGLDSIGIGRTAPSGFILGFANNFAASFRNNANSAECPALGGDTSDRVVLGGATSCFPHFPRTGANPPFTVASGTATVVTNLDADKVDGRHLFTASATLDFDLTSVASQDLTVTTTGATTSAFGCAVLAPNASVTADTLFWCWVSAADTVTVRAMRIAGTPNPGSGTFRVTVTQ